MARERIIVDPGIGFGKDIDGNLEIIRRLREFSTLGRPILLAASRKNFIGRVTGKDPADRLYGTAAVVAVAICNGAAVVRVHDVKEMRDVADMAGALCPKHQ
jgi:dihydropteroate synthase